jgi:hypothetical protein
MMSKIPEAELARRLQRARTASATALAPFAAQGSMEQYVVVVADRPTGSQATVLPRDMFIADAHARALADPGLALTIKRLLAELAKRANRCVQILAFEEGDWEISTVEWMPFTAQGGGAA